MASDDREPVHMWAVEMTEDLFHADTEQEPGESNIQMFGFNIQPQVFLISAFLILAFIIYTQLFPETAGEMYTTLFDGINANFGWWYVLVANLFILFVLYFGASKYGKIRLGGVDAEKEFSDVSWVAMLFSAGMGIGLMFWSVAEPIAHYGALVGNGNEQAAAETAMLITYYHWAFHPWAIYAIVGLGIGFFAFNRGLPMTFRSIFWPVLGNRIYGWWGHAIDILAVFATIFGLATSLGFGAMQINAGLGFLGEDLLGVAIPVDEFVAVILIAIITSIAVVSVWLGIHRGIRVLSNVNVFLMLVIMLAVLIVGPTLFILGVVPQAVGAYLMTLPEIALMTEAFGTAPYEGIVVGWTAWYWGWWIAWSPFVGMFIARISRGRTVREFVGGVLVIPVVFSFLFIGILGGAGLHQVVFEGIEIAAFPEEEAMFEFLLTVPGTVILTILTIILVTTFFVTSSDSGSLVLGHLSSGGLHDAPRNQRVSWAILEGAVAAVLLVGGGIGALQTASVTVGLPFSIVLLFMCYAIWRGLGKEYETLQSEAFTVRLDELSEEYDLVIRKTGGGVVTRVREGDTSGPAPTDD